MPSFLPPPPPPFSLRRILFLVAHAGLASAGTAPAGAQPAAVPLPAAEIAQLEPLYTAWKEQLSPERQAWETLLEENLGPFYLPRHKRDKVQGIANAWDFVADDPALPRVLLIGDSISRGYTLPTRRALAGRANVHRAPENCGATANGLAKLARWLGSGRWDLIHFNFGIHDRATPLETYEAQLDELTRRLLATGATLIWASSTPLPAEGSYGANAAIEARNAVARGVMARHGVLINDLYAVLVAKLSTYQKPNDVHLNDAGYEWLATHVAAEIGRGLSGRLRSPPRPSAMPP
jgi:lysophospholipase L1-like esterase